MSSDLFQIPHVLSRIPHKKFIKILDIGFGYGKYGWLIKNDYLREMHPYLVGIEAFEPYMMRLLNSWLAKLICRSRINNFILFSLYFS